MGVMATVSLLALGLLAVQSGPIKKFERAIHNNHHEITVPIQPEDAATAQSISNAYLENNHNLAPEVPEFTEIDDVKHLLLKKPVEIYKGGNSFHYQINHVDKAYEEPKILQDNDGYTLYKSTKSVVPEGPHQVETIETKSYHKEVPKFDTSDFKVNHDSVQKHGKKKEIHYHKHKHMHKHEHKQEHKHEHKQDHKHEHKNDHHHSHDHKQSHEHKHHQDHKHIHEHKQEHKHDHKHKHKHGHDHHHGHKHHHDEMHKHGHKHHHKQEHQHENSHEHHHHQEHKHDHHHDHHQEHKHKHGHHHSNHHDHKHDHHHKHHRHHKHHSKKQRYYIYL